MRRVVSGCFDAGINCVCKATSRRLALAAAMLFVSAVILSCSGGSDTGDTGRLDVDVRDAVDMDAITSDTGAADLVSEGLFQTDADLPDTGDTT
ncbi:hypothetical protein KBA39_01435, partial [Myxococcota bacterium]|nr:hypothetical protein [Myxococcota bacterium]